jgi:hypothetical protein
MPLSILFIQKMFKNDYEVEKTADLKQTISLRIDIEPKTDLT